MRMVSRGIGNQASLRRYVDNPWDMPELQTRTFSGVDPETAARGALLLLESDQQEPEDNPARFLGGEEWLKKTP
jgi:hypothetical protein